MAQWVEEFVENLSRRNPEISRSYQEAIKDAKKRFFKGAKHKEMNATSKLLKQRSNQHVKYP